MRETLSDLGRMGRWTLGVAAAWAIVGPCLLAFSSSARALAAEYLPPSGSERLLVLTVLTAGLIEVVRLSHARRSLRRKLRDCETNLALLRRRHEEPINAPQVGDKSLVQVDGLQAREVN